MSPIYEDSNTTREHLFELRKNNRCQECHGRLDVFMDFDRGKAFLACAEWNRSHHEGIEREAKPLFEPNIPTRREIMTQEYGEARTRALEKYVGVVSLTKVEAMEILKTIWPDAPAVEVLKAAMICHQYGLNPLMNHVFLIPFKRRQRGVVVGEDWVTVLGIKVNRLLAQRRHNYSYLDMTPRRMTDEEQKKIMGEVDDTKIWAITKIKDMDTHAEAMGIGSWPKDEVPYGSEKGNTKLNMASIRSERQALDRQYPGEMPQGVEVVDEEYVAQASTGEFITEARKEAEAVAEELKMGEGEKVGARAPKARAQTKKSETAPAETKSPDEVAEDDIPDLNALCKACFHFWGMQPADVWRELSYKTMMDVTESPWDCWLKIKALKTG